MYSIVFACPKLSKVVYYSEDKVFISVIYTKKVCNTAIFYRDDKPECLKLQASWDSLICQMANQMTLSC